MERESKVIEVVREEKQKDRGCKRGKEKLQMMIERKSKFREDVREENKVTEDDMEEKQRYRGRWRVKAK